MLCEAALIDKLRETVKIPLDEYGFDERQHDGTIPLGLLEVAGLDRAIHHRTVTGVTILRFRPQKTTAAMVLTNSFSPLRFLPLL